MLPQLLERKVSALKTVMKNIEDIYSLSPMQESVLRHGLDAAGTYIEQAGWTLRGELNAAAFESAWQRVIARNPVLRTSFFWEDLGQPVQVVREKVEFPYERYDWQAFTEDGQQQRLQSHLRADRSRGFDLSKAPLMRLIQIQLGQEFYQLIWSYHQSLLDRWSASLILKDVFLFYNALCQGHDRSLPPARPYRDYIAWLQQQDLFRAEGYWRKTLKDFAAPTLLATGRESEAAQPSNGNYGERQICLPVVVTDELRSFAQRRQLKFETIIQAVYSLLLSQWSGKEDVVFGAFVSGRVGGLPGIESMVGPFANALPVRVMAQPEASLLSWLKNLQNQQAALHDYSYSSLPKVQEWSEVPKGAPLFESVVIVNDSSLDMKVGADIGNITSFGGWTDYPLTIKATIGAELSLNIIYDRGRFDDSTITRMAGYLELMLKAIASGPDQRLSDIMLLAQRERHLVAEHDTGRVLVQDDRQMELSRIEAVLRQHPAVREVAVVDKDKGGQLVAYVVIDETSENHKKAKEIQFSLFYFADANSGGGEDKYRIYIEGARFADAHGFNAVWTPERHFHSNGGLYPNPSVLSAALAMITKNVRLRAGSVVMPLHHVVRVAEEWSIVDNLSKGRAGISFTSGWIPNDFAFFPERYANKREEMFSGIEQLKRLWRGQTITARDGASNVVELEIFPKPIQPELPIWLTCSGDPWMFENAGELGVNVLTALLTQSLEETATKVALYRESLAKHGHDPRSGHVTLMMHTFIGDNLDYVLEKVRTPFCNYLKSHVGLMETMAKSLNIRVDLDKEDWLDYIVSFAFERYYRTASLLGTPTTCLKMIERLKAMGVDEVACLIDFGVDVDSVIESLRHLNELKQLSQEAAEPLTVALSDFARVRLPDHSLPTAFVLVDKLPKRTDGLTDLKAKPVTGTSF